jgi:hypothetical protein
MYPKAAWRGFHGGFISLDGRGEDGGGTAPRRDLFVVLRRAWFVFEPKTLAVLVAALKRDGLTDKDTEIKML